MTLQSRTIPVHQVDEAVREAMFCLMNENYTNVTRGAFEHDLDGKDWVVLLEDQTDHALCGFSTQRLFEHEYKGERVLTLFSGDTIIRPTRWGGLSLPLAWGRLMQTIRDAHPECGLYWLLTTKGYRTYRFLPVFFKSFWPRFDIPTPPWEAGLMKSLGVRMWSEAYDQASGIIRAAPDAQRMHAPLDTVSSAARNNPHVIHFFAQNPGYREGDELVCLAEFSEKNLVPFIRKRLKQRDISPV